MKDDEFITQLNKLIAGYNDEVINTEEFGDKINALCSKHKMLLNSEMPEKMSLDSENRLCFRLRFEKVGE